MTIPELLAARHAKDVWVEECKTGATWSGAPRRLDGWALLKTWSPVTTIGYEIKTSRGDFLRDRKWVEYLPYCHELYFVCPAKLIAPEELPADVGLIWAGARLLTKRKAARREPQPSALGELMMYVLMSRTRIVAHWGQAQNVESREEFWRRWLADGAQAKDLGYKVGRAIGDRLREAQSARRIAEHERDRLEAVKAKLAELGLDASTTPYQLERLGEEHRGKLDQIRRLAERVQALATVLEA